ncbi:hypothetical protein [Glutamicibacter sp.]|uniref:hypothetical protein n=1 Tax=Glutamicibacter sp. TaxID=1931995 RepID=UPI002B48B915|nr:hypothetical protein [Glutamicibacter sp.]HJX79181.1 hypothetical protein [Glutamicibacter sp.]
MNQEIEKTKDVSLWINGSVEIEIEKIDIDWYQCQLFDHVANRCFVWHKQQIESMILSGFNQVID